MPPKKPAKLQKRHKDAFYQVRAKKHMALFTKFDILLLQLLPTFHSCRNFSEDSSSVSLVKKGDPGL